MPLLDLNEDRDVRAKALMLGHIRLGVFNGRHPQQSETFVFTSTDRARLQPLAEDFGGEITSYDPQGAGADSWRLISEHDAFTALFPFPDVDGNLSQDWMLWQRSGLKRRCDGFACSVFDVDEVTGEITEDQKDCICAAKNKRECKPETRLRFLLPQTGLGIWELTTNSKIAAMDLHDQVGFIATAAGGRLNHLPIRVVYAPREISYVEDGKRHTTTKRLVSLSIAGDAEHALAALAMKPDRALIAAVQATLKDAGRELLALNHSPALPSGEEEAPTPEAPTAHREDAIEDNGGETSGEPGAEDLGQDDAPAPTDDGEKANDEQWTRAAKAKLTRVEAIRLANKLVAAGRIAGPAPKSQAGFTRTQLEHVIVAYLDGERG